MIRLANLAAALALVLIFATSAPRSLAQQPPPIAPQAVPVPPQTGDVLWAFAQEPPFNDSRIALAVATGVDAKLRPAGGAVYYAEQRGPQILAYREQSPAPLAQVPLLLTAAGFPPAPPGSAAATGGLSRVRESGRCRIWSANDSSASTAATQLTAALQDSLASLGLQTQVCQPTPSASDADVLVWVQGGPPPVIPVRQQSSFLALPGPASAPSGPLVPSPSGAPPFVPPRTGDGGLLAP